MHLVQFNTCEGDRRVARVSDDSSVLHLLADTATIYDLARAAIAGGGDFATLVEARLGGGEEDYGRAAT